MKHLRELAWVGSSKEDLLRFPEAVQREIGYALHLTQAGDKPDNAKPLTGLGSGILEIVSDYNKGTYRAVYAIKIGELIYVLHCFQKKSKQGIKTPKQELDLVKQRLESARAYANQRQSEKK